MKIVEASWTEHRDALAEVRAAVFVVEQSVPKDLEWDGQDERAYHWLALEGDKPIGTVRMLRDGHIGRLAVLNEYRGRGIGRDLLNRIIRHAKMLNLREAWLNSQTHAIGFYEQFGFQAYGPEFQDAGLPHRAMRLTFRQNFILGKDAGRHATDDIAGTIASISSQCRRQLRIFSERLEPDIYDNETVRMALSELARLHKATEIRILVLKPELLASRGHRILALQHRLSSSILLRALPEDQAGQVDEEFLVADNAGLVVSKRHEPGKHWADFSNRPAALNYILQFDVLWNQASEDPRLRRLTV